MSTPSASRGLKVGYLHVGPPEHGICRYGRLLAKAAHGHRGISVLERSLVLSGQASEDKRLLRHAAQELAAADLVHIQVSVWAEGTWGGAWRSLANLRTFRRHCRARLIATLHDVNSIRPSECVAPGRLVGRALLEPFRMALRPGARCVLQLWRGRLEPAALFRELWRFEPHYPWLVAREVARLAQTILVLTESEQAALHAIGIAKPVAMIPHFVEELPARETIVSPVVRQGITVVVAGFIFGSKGHELVLEAMPLLPDVKVVFLGGPSIGSSPAQRDRLLEIARRYGVQSRLEVTGYLPDPEYLERIYKADLGLCPFAADKSASGSLATLIAAGCPVLASDIPPIAELNALVPGAIRTFRPYTPEALAGAIRATLATPRAALTEALGRLRARLSISVIYEEHAREYRRVLEGEGVSETA